MIATEAQDSPSSRTPQLLSPAGLSVDCARLIGPPSQLRMAHWMRALGELGVHVIHRVGVHGAGALITLHLFAPRYLGGREFRAEESL